MLVNGKIKCKSSTPTDILGSADDIQHCLPEIRQIFRGKSQHQPHFKFGVVAGVSVLTTPTPAFDTELEITHCKIVTCTIWNSKYQWLSMWYTSISQKKMTCAVFINSQKGKNRYKVFNFFVIFSCFFSPTQLVLSNFICCILTFNNIFAV